MVRLTMLGGFGLISGGIAQLRPRIPCGTQSSKAPISNPFSCGRGNPRWSMVREVPASAVSNAELSVEIAIVGVIPGELNCNGPSNGSAVETTPGQFEADVTKLPWPKTFVFELAEHSIAPGGKFAATIVLSRVNESASETTIPPPEPVV